MTAEAAPGASSGWRRRNSSEGARTRRVEIKLIDEEYARAKAAATVRNCSMPAVLVFMSAWAADGAVAARRVEMLQDDLLNPPGMSGDSEPWEGWSHVRDTSRRYPAELKERAVGMVAEAVRAVRRSGRRCG